MNPPVLVVLAIIWAVFYSQSSAYLSFQNITNLTLQIVTTAILALGGTITHHHAVGRDHRRWYLREVPPLFTDALRSAKAELDPAGIMNPGVLMPPTRRSAAP